MKFKIATLMIVILAAAICLAIYVNLNPSKVSIILDKIERISEDDPGLDVDLLAVTYDPRGQYTKFFSKIEGDYYLQTWVQITPNGTDNELFGVAVIKRVSMGTWEYVFPIYLDGIVAWKYDAKIDDPFEYQHIVAGSGASCICPDCQSQKD